MQSNPDSLKELCLQYIVENSSTVFAINDNLEKISRDRRLTLPTTVVDRLLLHFSERRKLDNTSLLNLIGKQIVHLKCVRLLDCALVTNWDSLQAHQIEQLSAIGCRTTVDDLLGCLNGTTLNCLTNLDVSWTKHLWNPFKMNKRRLSISRLNNLRFLNVSHTRLENGGLKEIVDNLTILENLNISSTKVTDISPILKCQKRLRSLRMYNLRDCDDDVSMAVLAQMDELRLLDVSIERPDQHRMFVSETRFRAGLLIWHRDERCLPHLEVLDISGRKDITLENLKVFLDCHTKIKFLGLMQTELCNSDGFLKEFKGLKTTGNFNWEQVQTSLICYKDRPQFIEECMSFLYRESQANPKIFKSKLDIMSVILPNLMLYPKKLTLLLLTTGFIGNVLNNDLSNVKPMMLAKVVDNLLIAMENYPKNIKLQENVLLALRNESIYVPTVIFDYRKCGRLVLKCFKHFDNNDFHDMSLNICHRTCRMLLMKGEPVSLLARREEMAKMLDILRKRVELKIVDEFMLTILKSFGNLTCNTPENGQLFIEEGGIEVFYDILESFPDMTHVTKYLLPTTHSIALFAHLRHHLAEEKIILKLREYLWSKDFLIAYHIAADLILLAMDDSEIWKTLRSGAREDTLNDVFDRLQVLTVPEEIPFTIRSFQPGYMMLDPSVPYQAQLWIVYTIHIFCNYDILGPIRDTDLGTTLCHEHLSMDFSFMEVPPPPGTPLGMTDCPFTLENFHWINRNPFSHKVNLYLNDKASRDAISEEMKLFVTIGGNTIVDNTTLGLKGDVKFLKKLAMETPGLNIIAGSGYYVARSQTDSVLNYTVEQLADNMRAEMTEGFDGTSIKAGILGELASVYPMESFEKRVLQAAAIVQRELQCPVIVHPHRVAESPYEIVRIYSEAGGNVEKLVMSHLDRTIPSLLELSEFAEMRTFIEFDMFGIECSHYQLNESTDMPSDAQRVQLLKGLIDDGLEDRIVVGHDVYAKHRLTKFGGHGYSHILRNIVPKMLNRGISQEAIDKILRENPKKWLC